jgi:GDPmannose 4,6-dehydratase
MLNHDRPDDFVVGTGATHSVRQFLEVAFGELGLDYQDYVVVDERFYRPAEVELLQADPTKAKKELGWEPEVTFQGLVKMMVQSDLERLSS